MKKSGNVASHCDPSPRLDPSPAELKMTPAFDLSSDPSRHKVTSSHSHMATGEDVRM